MKLLLKPTILPSGSTPIIEKLNVISQVVLISRGEVGSFPVAHYAGVINVLKIDGHV